MLRLAFCFLSTTVLASACANVPTERSAQSQWGNGKIVVRHAGEGDSFNGRGDNVGVIKLTTEETGGRFNIQEDNFEAHFARPLHLHEEHSETFYIVEGESEWVVGPERFIARPGTLIHVPRNTPHSVKSISKKTGKSLMFYEPGGFDQFVRAMAAAKTAEERRALQETIDFTLVE